MRIIIILNQKLHEMKFQKIVSSHKKRSVDKSSSLFQVKALIGGKASWLMKSESARGTNVFELFPPTLSEKSSILIL